MKRILSIFFLLCVCCLTTISSHAQETVINGNTRSVTTYSYNEDITITGEHIRSFMSDITANLDGTIHVKETILYDFDNLERHGIYRIIPHIKTNKDGKKFQMTISPVSVTDENGSSYTYKTTYENGELSLKIGDANKTVTGLHTYVITYDVSGAYTYFSDHDELFWNITGFGWKIPFSSVKATISFPQTIQGDVQTVCYTGKLGSTEQACDVSLSHDGATTATITTKRILYPGENMSVAMRFPINIIAHVEPKPVINFFDTILGKIISFFIVLAVLLWYVIYPIWLPIKWWLHGRDPRSNTGPVSAWYEPPKTKKSRPLTPGETGTLIDESVDLRDIQATIIDLARRGYIKIVEKKKDDFSLIRNTDFSEKIPLQEFETKLLSGMFGAKTEIRLKDERMTTTVETVKKLLYEGMVSDDLFAHNPQSTRIKYGVITGLALFTFNIPLVLMSLIFGMAMSKRTLYGVEQKNVAKSLYNFLSSQERQLTFQAEKQMFFEKLLPYAVAFGVEKIWAERFKDMGLKQPDWYDSYDHNRMFNAVLFSHAMQSSYASFRTAATPVSSSSGFSSGFSSGGGFSGGGGGGGGGGSW